MTLDFGPIIAWWTTVERCHSFARFPIQGGMFFHNISVEVGVETFITLSRSLKQLS